MNRLFKPIFGQFKNTFINDAPRIIAEGNAVVVECKGEVVTKNDMPYNNTYCWICTFKDGRLMDVTEYLDTALVNAVLEKPGN